MDLLAVLNQKKMRPFISVVIKPTLECNIDCKHCYHTPEERIGDRISVEIVERLFRLISEEYESVWFVWHGGEPLLLSQKFYREVIALQEKYFGKDSHRVGNTIQTNGILLEKGFIEFCKDKKINIGISHEGPFNDALRQETETSENNLRLLSKKDRVFSVSSTISSATESKQVEMYEYFKGNRTSASFSPVIPAGCALRDRSLVPDPDAFIRSSIEMFDRWLFDKETEIPLIPHYLYILNALGEPTESDCAHTSCLTKWMCLYPNGDIYPCGKGCPSEFKMCNISDIEHISDVFRTEGFVRILRGSVERREKCKNDCELFSFCNGGCSVDAYFECGIENAGGDSCKIFKAVFGHILKTMNDITKERPDLSVYNKFVREAVLGKMINPKITTI